MDYLTITNLVLPRLSQNPITDTESASNPVISKLVLQYINECIYEIHGLTNQWNWGEQEYTTTFLPNQSTYAIPSTINQDTIQVVRIGNTALTYVDYKVYDLNRDIYDVYSDGFSPFYTIFEKNLVILAPTNYSTGTLYVTYQLRPAMLIENDDEPAIPEDYRFVLVDGAEYKTKQFLSMPDTAVCKAQYDEWITKMMRNNKNYGQADYQMKLDDNYENDWTKY